MSESKYDGIKDKCCTDNNMTHFRDKLWQCNTCKRLLRMKDKFWRQLTKGLSDYITVR